MTDTTAQLLQEQDAILRAALDLQQAQLAQATASQSRMDNLLTTIINQNAQILSALEITLKVIRNG